MLRITDLWSKWCATCWCFVFSSVPILYYQFRSMVSIWSYDDIESDFPYNDSVYRTMCLILFRYLSNYNTFFGSSFRIVAILYWQFWSIVPRITDFVTKCFLVMLDRNFLLLVRYYITRCNHLYFRIPDLVSVRFLVILDRTFRLSNNDLILFR